MKIRWQESLLLSASVLLVSFHMVQPGHHKTEPGKAPLPGESPLKEEARGVPEHNFGFLDAIQVDRNFNASFSLNIPLFTVIIPGAGRGNAPANKLSAINVGNIALLGIVVLGAVALFYPLFLSPLGFRSFEQGRSGNGVNGSSSFFSNGLIGISEFVMSKVENSLDDLPSLPRLEPQECMKRSICEANHQPKKYGILGLGIQLLFPPYTESNNPGRVVSKYQLAARYGRQETANCASQYDGCMFNFLDVVQTVISTVFKFT